WVLAVRASRSVRVWLRGVAVGRARKNRSWSHDVQLPQETSLAGSLTLPLPAEGATVSILLLPDRRRGQPARGGKVSLAGRITGLLLAASNDRGRRLIAQFPAGPLPAMLAFERGETGQVLSRALDRTLDHLPHHTDARIDRARVAREGAQVGLARQLMAPLARAALAGARTRNVALQRRSDLQFGLAALRQLDGLGDLAVAHAEEAVRHQPGDCPAYWQAAEIASDALDRDALRRLLAVASAASCLAAAPLRHAQLLEFSGQTAAALGVLKRASTLPGLAERARAKARALAPSARLAWAWTGASPGTLAARASAEALVAGRPVMARAAWTRILLGKGMTPTQRRGAWLLGARRPWAGLTVDGAKWVRAHPAPKTSKTAVTWLLDHEIVVALPGGGALRRVHQIVRVHTAQAAESVGELSVPANAELVLARTHTLTGQILSPADTPDKETTSLRGVAPGAAVEYVQVQFLGASDQVSGATRTPVFLLQSRDGAVVDSRFEVLDRPAQGLTARVDQSPKAPKVQLRKHGPWRLRRWQSKETRRFRVEPRANRAAWHLAAVRASVGATVDSVTGPWEDALAAFLVRDPAGLGPWPQQARKAGKRLRAWRQLITKLTAKVGHKRSGITPGSPFAAVSASKGDRATLLYWLARHAGVKACLVRIRPWSRQPGYGAPDPADFSLSALTLQLTDKGSPRTIWLDPGVDGAMVNYLRPGLRNRPALRLGCEGPTEVTTPSLGAELDKRDVHIDLHWAADGQVAAKVTDTLRGVLAVIVRNALKFGGKDQRIAILRQLSSASFPGMKPAWSGVSGLGGGPLVLRYEVRSPAAAHRRSRVILGLMPYRLARRYATLANRRMTLRFGHQLDLSVTVKVTSEGGGLLSPTPVVARHKMARVHQTVSHENGTLRIDHRLVSTMGLVPPKSYVPFAKTLRAIDRSELLILRRTPAISRK
ncbi:MAG: hypothetical protein KC502_21010, partial [Myxococcales bacterium]|nr:hypothetical protein [Myxococcales bacterium]